jgi:hypothetical protein
VRLFQGLPDHERLRRYAHAAAIRAVDKLMTERLGDQPDALIDANDIVTVAVDAAVTDLAMRIAAYLVLPAATRDAEQPPEKGC